MNRILTRDPHYYRDLLHLSIPVALQNLITFLVSFADNLMVNELGDAAGPRNIYHAVHEAYELAGAL